MDDSMRTVVLEEVRAELARLWDELAGAAAGDLAVAEGLVRAGVLAIGARLLAASVAAQGTGKGGARIPCACGSDAPFEGYRAKQVQTVVGWITIRRAYYACPGCARGGVRWMPSWGWRGTASVLGCGASRGGSGAACPSPRRRPV